MNISEMQTYVLDHVKDLTNLDITPYQDGSFYLKAKSAVSSCGALFSDRGFMHSLAGISFSQEDSELMSQIEDAITEFRINNKTN